MGDIDAAEDWLDSWTAGVNEQARAAADLARQVSALSGTAESRDGAIRVTVGSTGQIERLELADAELGRRIMRVMHEAQARLATAVAATVEETVGADTETGRAVIHSFETRFPAPPPPPDDHER
jgi:predicted site-specific integrase-resolvase